MADALASDGYQVLMAECGVEGLKTLRSERVDVVILDLILPDMSGTDVLQEIKADEDLARIPVVILTTSQAEEDVIRSYDLHANCYITKPVDLDQFIKVINMVEGFWLSMVKLPVT